MVPSMLRSWQHYQVGFRNIVRRILTFRVRTGAPAVIISKLITVIPFNGPSVSRAEVRSLSSSRWTQIVNAMHLAKSLGVHDHFVYVHEVGACCDDKICKQVLTKFLGCSIYWYTGWL